jgi:hypothetical protein
VRDTGFHTEDSTHAHPIDPPPLYASTGITPASPPGAINIQNPFLALWFIIRAM